MSNLNRMKSSLDFLLAYVYNELLDDETPAFRYSGFEFHCSKDIRQGEALHFSRISYSYITG